MTNPGTSPTTTADLPLPAAEVRRLYQALARRPSLVPGPEVDALFGRLVGLVVALGVTEAAATLADPVVQRLRPDLQRLCAEGETELERAWTTRIAGSPSPAAELERFPYADNYRRLTELEWSMVRGAGGRRPRRVAFIGSGPLPLSALLLARHHHVEVDGFDRDPEAVAQGRAVVRALHRRGLRFRHGDTAECPDLGRYDLVVLAALVGATPAAKRAAVHQVRGRMRPGAMLAVRSAHAARSLLYPVLDLDALTGFDLLRVVHPFDQVINSVVLARRPADPPPPWRAPAPAPDEDLERARLALRLPSHGPPVPLRTRGDRPSEASERLLRQYFSKISIRLPSISERRHS